MYQTKCKKKGKLSTGTNDDDDDDDDDDCSGPVVVGMALKMIAAINMALILVNSDNEEHLF